MYSGCSTSALNKTRRLHCGLEFPGKTVIYLGIKLCWKDWRRLNKLANIGDSL